MDTSGRESGPIRSAFARFQKQPLWAGIVLFVLTIFVFWPTISYDFVDYDDNVDVTENQFVLRGLTLNGIVTVFTQPDANNYHPLTTLSHMIDVQLFGLNPSWHHATNLVFHAINSALLFFVLLKLSGAFWRCLVVTAIVQWHPLRVESVAWITERKDVLSIFFALLTIYFYVLHTTASSSSSNGDSRHKARNKYLFLSLLFFACGLLSKPMLVTLPFMLLLLDFWPLGRIQVSNRGNFKTRLIDLFREKQWFFLLIIPAVFMTIWAQGSGGAIKTNEDFPVLLRLQSVPVSIVKYLGKIFWPTDLAVLYPYPPSFSISVVPGALVLLTVITVVFFKLSRRFPFLPVGWLWFLGGLVPVINLVQSGVQSMADRFVYLPSIGLIIAIAWLCCSILPRKILIFVSTIAVVACVAVTRHQLPFWKNRLALFERAAAVTDYNYIAHNNVADLLFAAGDSNGALLHYREAIRINPKRPEPRNNYAKALAQIGRTDEAVQEFAKLLRENPKYAKGYSNFGAVLVALGKTEEAEISLNKAVKLDPNDAEAHINLGNLFFRQAKTNDALTHYATAIRLNPQDATPHYWSARLLLNSHPAEAVEHLSEAVRLRPDWTSALTELAWIFATHPSSEIRNGATAVQLSTRACELTKFQDPKSLAALEVAYAEQSRFNDAIAMAEKGIELANQTGHPEKVDSLQKRIALYRLGKPLHQP